MFLKMLLVIVLIFSNSLFAQNATSSNRVCLASDLKLGYGTHVYYSTSTRIDKVSIDGGTVSTAVSTGSSSPMGVTTNGTYLYFLVSDPMSSSYQIKRY